MIDDIFDDQSITLTGEITTGGPFKGSKASVVFDSQGRGIVFTAAGDFVTFAEETRGLSTVMKVNP